MNSIQVPKSIKFHSNISDEEIRAYYSLHPVNASNTDYDFNKQLDRIITEYMEYQSFKTANARRCFKKQLKKMILVDKPKNSKKYDNFLSWRLKQIAQYKSKQRDDIIKNIHDTDLAEKYNDLYKKYNQQSNDYYALVKENQELKEKLKQYESMSMIDSQPKEEVIIEKVEEVIYYDEREVSSDEESEEESSDEESESESEEEEDIYNIKDVEPEKKEELKEIINELKEEPKNVSKQYEKLELVFKTNNITEEEYISMNNDDERLEAYWKQIDKGIDECEQYFIKTCNRDSDHITEISNIFYDFHNEEFGNVLEGIEGDVDIDKLDAKPFSILRDNLNQEAK